MMTEIIKHLFLKYNNIHHNFYIFRLLAPLEFSTYDIQLHAIRIDRKLEQRNERSREYIDIEGLDNAIVEKS